MTVAGGIGAVLLALGAVGPLARVPLVGSVRAWDVRPGDALVLAGVAVLALAMIRGGRIRLAWMPGLLAVGGAMWMLGQVQPVVADAGSLGAGIGVGRATRALLAGEFSVGWGFAALMCGCVVLCFVSGLATARGEG